MSIGNITQIKGGNFVHLDHSKIKAARTAKKLSQKTVAEYLNISQPGYQQIESGKYPDMKISTLIKLCSILEVDPNWLLGYNEDNPVTK